MIWSADVVSWYESKALSKARFTWSTEPHQILTLEKETLRQLAQGTTVVSYFASRASRIQFYTKLARQLLSCSQVQFISPTSRYWVVYYAGIVCKNASTNCTQVIHSPLQSCSLESALYFDSNNLMWKCNIDCAVPIPVHTGFVFSWLHK